MVIISYKASGAFKEFLRENNIKYIETMANPNLDPRIADHPDLSLFVLDDQNIVVADEVYDYYKEKIPSYNLIRGESTEKTYPMDAIYNVVRFNDYYVHNDFTETNIKKYFSDRNIAHLSVKQGYTRCSSIVLKSTILTSDFGIYKSLKDKIDIELLDEDTVALDGFDQGFLGGTCTLYEDKLIFTGDISKHRAYPKIKEICQKESIKIFFPKCPLVDLGSLIFL